MHTAHAIAEVSGSIQPDDKAVVSASVGSDADRHAAIIGRLEIVKPHAEAITVFLYAVRDASQIVAEAHVPQKQNDDGFKWRLAEAFLDNYINF